MVDYSCSIETENKRMNEEKKLGKRISKLFEAARKLELLPRALWVEEVDNVVFHLTVRETTEQ